MDIAAAALAVIPKLPSETSPLAASAMFSILSLAATFTAPMPVKSLSSAPSRIVTVLLVLRDWIRTLAPKEFPFVIVGKATPKNEAICPLIATDSLMLVPITVSSPFVADPAVPTVSFAPLPIDKFDDVVFMTTPKAPPKANFPLSDAPEAVT